jgi:hypothetical protein
MSVQTALNNKHSLLLNIVTLFVFELIQITFDSFIIFKHMVTICIAVYHDNLLLTLCMIYRHMASYLFLNPLEFRNTAGGKNRKYSYKCHSIKQDADKI